MSTLDDVEKHVMSSLILTIETNELAKSINGYKFSLSNIEMNALLARNDEILNASKKLINECSALMASLYKCAKLVSEYSKNTYITNYEFNEAYNLINDIKNKRNLILPNIRALEMSII